MKGHIAKVCRTSPRQPDKKNPAQPITTGQNAHFVDTDQATPDEAGCEINNLWNMFTVNIWGTFVSKFNDKKFTYHITLNYAWSRINATS